MIYTRGQPQDYDAWAALGCKGWAFADVLPYFKRSEDNARGPDALHGVGGPLHVSDLSYRNPAVEAFVEAAVQAGFRRNARLQRRDAGRRRALPGVPEERAAVERRSRLSASFARANLAIFSDCQARRILFEGGRAVGVAYGRGASGRAALCAARDCRLRAAPSARRSS